MYAEHYAQVIQYVWGYVGARSYLLQGDLQTVAQNIPRLRLDGPGIYSLWLKSSFHENKYVPTYVGFTSRPIQTRLGEHARFGKIGELYSGLPDGAATTGGIGVLALELPTPMARAMESVFLEAFDFAQNTADNLMSRALRPWTVDADLSEDAPMPESAGDNEAFNDLLTAISDQLEALQDLQTKLMQLKG
ncbi:hypothetical protein LJR257_006721 [Ensifer adhaerens]